MIKKRKKFIRRNWDKYKRIGRKKKQVWRKPRGRHGKMRERRKGYPSCPEIGLKNPNKIVIKMVRNLNELIKTGKGESVVLSRVGKKKRIEIEKKAAEIGVKIINLKK